MGKNWVSSTLATVLVVIGLFIGLSNALTGCSRGTSMARVVDGLRSPFTILQEESVDHKRFKKSFRQMAAMDGFRSTQLRHFFDAYDRVRTEYVNKIDDKFLMDLAIKGVEQAKGDPGKIPSVKVIESALDTMVSSLDPHSSYMNPREYRDSQATTSGQFGGLGIEIKMTDGFIEIISPMADTPAFRAGLKSGDFITHVDGISIKEMSLGSAVRRLRGRPGSDVKITILRSDVGSFFVTLTRAIIRVQPVKSRIEGNIGVLRITHFNVRTLETMEHAIQEIRSKLGARLKGLVIDLRNNPGGLLNQSVDIADAFLNSGKIVSVRDRDGEVRGFEAQYGDIINGLPIVILINRGSASASEIVAGALQDHRRATLMGMRSFGKGSVQTITPLYWDGALRLTTALYYLPTGRTIQGAGVNPDLIISDKKASEGKREVDLPNALIMPNHIASVKVGRQLNLDWCPAAGNRKEDKLLGCAVMFLDSGSKENFFALLIARKNL